MKTKTLTMRQMLKTVLASLIFLTGSAFLTAQTHEDEKFKKSPYEYDTEDNVFNEKRTTDVEAKTMTSAKASSEKMSVNQMPVENYHPEYWNKKYEDRSETMASSGMERQTMQQEDEQLEATQKKREKKMEEIYGIVMEYPGFTYEYMVGPEGELKEVVITGVENKEDKEVLATLLVDLYEFNRQLMNRPMTTGAYYITEDEAEPQQGYEDFFNQLYSNLSYPDEAENQGVEGTMYVKFVVDEQGEIENMRVDHDIETPYPNALEEMKESAKQAVKSTSGNWEPATIGGEKVSEFVVIPVTFDFEINPALKAPIR